MILFKKKKGQRDELFTRSDPDTDVQGTHIF
jgi:hypothetical protein